MPRRGGRFDLERQLPNDGARVIRGRRRRRSCPDVPAGIVAARLVAVLTVALALALEVLLAAPPLVVAFPVASCGPRRSATSVPFSRTGDASPRRFFAKANGGGGGGGEKAEDKGSPDVNVSTTTRIYLDVAVSDQPIGRLELLLPNPNPLPLHAENVVGLCRGSRRSIDPAATYVGCEFSYSAQFIEGMAQYRWGHVLKGRGRNAVGKADGRIEEKEALSRCQVSAFGGSYYGLRYGDLPGVGDDGEGGAEGAVALTVPLSGPGRGSSTLSVVRVGDSPREWGERLLMNSAVLGWMDPACGDVLRTMARQRVGPPVVVACGVLEEGDDGDKEKE